MAQSRQNALARSVKVEETQHTMHRRHVGHHYDKPGTYMVTIVVAGRQPVLGALHGDEECAWVLRSALGDVIYMEEMPKITSVYPMVKVWQSCIMPDHIHMILRVDSDLPQGKHLGNVVGAFKGGCTRAAKRLGVIAATPSGCSGHGEEVSSLFEKGYNDKILMRLGQLTNWDRYLTDNLRRLLVKRNNPHLFVTMHDVELMGRKCQMLGNRFLLDVPDKMAVIVHRRDSDEDFACKKRQWLACAEGGGVLVSAAIAQREKVVLREALDAGGRIILLRENGFPALYKPSGNRFKACSQGKLLEISPWEYHNEKKTISRRQCLELNDLALHIAEL